MIKFKIKISALPWLWIDAKIVSNNQEMLAAFVCNSRCVLLSSAASGN